MRRLYVAPLDVHMAHSHIRPASMTYWMALYNPATPGAAEAWEAAGKPVVITMHFQSGRHQDLWEDNPAVTVLPHPVYSPGQPILTLQTTPESKSRVLGGQTPTQDASLPVGLGGVGALRGTGKLGYQPNGDPDALSDGVSHLILSGLGVCGSDTVHDVHEKLSAWHPGFKLRLR